LRSSSRQTGLQEIIEFFFPATNQPLTHSFFPHHLSLAYTSLQNLFSLQQENEIIIIIDQNSLLLLPLVPQIILHFSRTLSAHLREENSFQKMNFKDPSQKMLMMS
jgi:hypothetical protein